MAQVQEVKNLNQAEHEHICPECGGTWKCRLMLSGEVAGRLVVGDKGGRKACIADAFPMCFKCETPESLGLKVCKGDKCGRYREVDKKGLCLPCSDTAKFRAENQARGGK
jgi:hypothetical protein